MRPMGNPSLRSNSQWPTTWAAIRRTSSTAAHSAIYAQYAAARSPNDGNRAEHATDATQARTQGLRTADTIRFGYYACKGGQLYRVMQGYKNSDDASATEYLNDIKYIAFDALRIHYDCIASCTGAPPTAWATIPSTKSSPNYGKPNPLTP